MLSNAEAGAGDQSRYDRFFETTLSEHHGMIARVVSSYERNKALQEELYQEISVALWRALGKFDQRASIKTYILSIAHKRAVSHVAKYVKEPSSVDINEFEQVGSDCPSESMTTDRKMSLLMEQIRLLPLLDRQLVTLALEGLSYKEIAEILGITVSNVGAKLNRAKTKLNRMMANGGEA